MHGLGSDVWDDILNDPMASQELDTAVGELLEPGSEYFEGVYSDEVLDEFRCNTLERFHTMREQLGQNHETKGFTQFQAIRVRYCNGRDVLSRELEKCNPGTREIMALFNQNETGPGLKDLQFVIRIVVTYSDWTVFPVIEGDMFNMLGPFCKCLEFREFGVVELEINRGSGIMFILCPNLMVSGTILAESFSCIRRSILMLLYPTRTGDRRCMVKGSILHELFQQCLATGSFEPVFISETLELVLQNHLETLASENLSYRDMRICVEEETANIIQWGKKYMQKEETLHVEKVLDIEDHIWSLKYGIRGKIDATLKISRDHQSYHVPLELKTGRAGNFIPHRVQTLLYMLLLSDKYKHLDVVHGLLLYLTDPTNMHVIDCHREHVSDIIGMRNRLVGYILGPSHDPSIVPDLPPILTNLHACQTCPVKDTCALFGRIDQPNPEHDFFRLWNQLVFYEERMEQRKMAVRDGLSEHYMDNLIAKENCGDHAVYSQRLDRAPLSLELEYAGQSTWRGEICEDDLIVVSCTTTRQLALGLGHIHSIGETSIMVKVDRDFRVCNQVLTGNSEKHACAPKLYRIDRMETRIGYSHQRGNLVTLLQTQDSNVMRLRQALIHSRAQNRIWSLDIPQELKSMFDSRLNRDQQRAILSCLSTQDFTVVLGLPGCGKTFTLAFLVRVLSLLGKTVMITSYTHNAVDNILTRLLSEFNDDSMFWRLGQRPSKASVLNEESCNINILIENQRGHICPEELKELYLRRKVVACTCLGTGHELFRIFRQFDYCIVDEASQITLPVIIGPLGMASKWVLVGDDNQLPPLVKSREFQLAGSDQVIYSLEKSLFEIWKSSDTWILRRQYRMCRDLMDFVNRVSYNGLLEYGPEGQEHLRAGQDGVEPMQWEELALDGRKCVVWIDTDSILKGQSFSIENKIEGEIVCRLIKTFARMGGLLANVTVLSPYRSQVFLIKTMLAKILRIRESRVDMVSTIDKYQGKENEIIVISFVESGESETANGLLEQWKRINVGITRAKRKLLMIGSRQTLRRHRFIHNIISHVPPTSIISPSHL